MAYLVVPHEASASTATIWVGAIDEAFDSSQVRLVSNLGDHPLLPTWEHWGAEDGTHHLDYQRLNITGLQPSSPIALQLLVNGQRRADARLMTLPSQLPTLAGKPFIVLLGSCFCRREDDEGSVGLAYTQLPPAASPDVKILCGDQVYLDDPWAHYLWHTHTPPELADRFFRTYYDTWTQEPGFRDLLIQGANYFAPDDHEYWNNAPNRATAIPDTWTSNGRKQWFALARQFYQMFQNPAPITTFTVEPLSFLIADTRSNRQPNQSDFMLPTDLDAVAQWIQNLSGPGVLVVGQPVFMDQSGDFKGTFFDWSLSDYTQYGELARLLAQAPHSIVILSGDVHYGRIACCTLTPGRVLVEVISSPMSLVDKKAEGNWQKAPSLFPPFAVPGVVPAPVTTLPKEVFSPIHSHFLTLEFAATGGQVQMIVRLWPAGSAASISGGSFGEVVFRQFLR
jgi:hypothetical protein